MYQQADALAIKGECLLLDFATALGHWPPRLPLTLGWSYTLSALWSSACRLQTLQLSAFTVVGGSSHSLPECLSVYLSVETLQLLRVWVSYRQLPERQMEA